MAIEAIVFDIGETLIDETMMWTRAAANAGVTPFTLMGVLGATIERGVHHNETWGILGVEHPEGTWVDEDWYPDAVPCIERLREAGYRVCAVGNTPQFVEEHVGTHVEVLGSSERWQIWKPDPRFFARVVEAVGVAPAKIAYVGDRVDNDLLPAQAAGMTAVRIRRGAHAADETPPGFPEIDSLADLPDVLR